MVQFFFKEIDFKTFSNESSYYSLSAVVAILNFQSANKHVRYNLGLIQFVVS